MPTFIYLSVDILLRMNRLGYACLIDNLAVWARATVGYPPKKTPTAVFFDISKFKGNLSSVHAIFRLLITDVGQGVSMPELTTVDISLDN